VEVARKVVENMTFLLPKFLGECPRNFFFGGGEGIHKSTPLPTYMPNLVEIPWLVFYLCWRNKKRNFSGKI